MTPATNAPHIASGPPSRPRFERFVEPARKRPAIWRILVGLLLVLVVYALGVFAVIGGAVVLTAPEEPMFWIAGLIEGDRPGGLLILLLTFAGMAIGPALAVRWLHARSVATLIGPASRALRDFVTAGAAILTVYAAALAAWSLFYDAVPGLPIGQWLALLPLTLAGLLLQTGAEELLFRGYFQQQLAARFRTPLMWMVLPALIFGLVHYDPEGTGGNAWLLVVSAAAFGLAAADLTALTGSLGAAWGFHFANNFVALGLLATKGTLPGLALYVTPYAIDEAGPLPVLLLTDIAILALAWALCRRLLRR